MTPPLSESLAQRVLTFLGVEPAPPDLDLLDRLIAAYIQAVPWESASRISRRQTTSSINDCPRWSEEFWESALRYGTGGTCFESNRAFFALLNSLGYQGYLTINNMQETFGCHTAIVIQLDGAPWLVDAGYPIHTALPLEPGQTTERSSPWLRYRAQSQGGAVYLIENRPHPRPYMFHLIDRPIADADYRAATIADYGVDGLFLNRVILRKVVAGDIWRFDSAASPAHLEQFRDGARIDHALDADPAAHLNRHFGIDTSIVRLALAAV